MLFCISMAQVFVLVMFHLLASYRPQGGLGIGDLLSPFPIHVGLEALSRLISRAVDGGFWRVLG